MRAFLMALLLGLSTAAIAQDDPEAPADEVVTEEAASEEAPKADEPAAVAPEGEEPAADAPETEGDEAAAEGSEVAAPDAATEEATNEAASDTLSDEEVMETVGLLMQALESKNWPLFFGLLLSLLVWAATRFGLKDVVGAKALPWVTMIVAVAGTVGAGLVAGLEISQVLLQGVLAGVAAIGGWELLLKHLLPKKQAPAEPEEAKTDPAAEAPSGDPPTE